MWLGAYRISELIVLQAQYLMPAARGALLAAIESLDIRVALVYTGQRAEVRSNSSVAAVLDRRRAPAHENEDTHAWPPVPDVEPMEFRAACATALTGDDRERVDLAFSDAAQRIRAWRYLDHHPSREQLREAVAVASGAHDPNLHRILMNGCLVGLLTQGRAAPSPIVSEPCFRGQDLPEDEIAELLSYIDPDRAATTFIRRWTDLPDDLIALIGPEQLTESSVAGVKLPNSVRPIFRALTQSGVGWTPSLPPSSRAQTGPTCVYYDDAEFTAEILSRCLAG